MEMEKSYFTFIIVIKEKNTDCFHFGCISMSTEIMTRHSGSVHTNPEKF